MRVLIIDDSRANRMVLQRFMKEFGFETAEAENGLDAIWALKRNPEVDVITVDYDMPKMTGVQFVRLIREKPELDDIKIVMITSQSSPQKRAEALEAGVNEFLVKPFDKEKVEMALNAMGVNTKGPPPALPKKQGEEAEPQASEDGSVI